MDEKSVEKEKLYEDFKERLINDGLINTKSSSYKNQNNLKPARDHFKFRAEKLRSDFEFSIWSGNGLNWPDWEFIKKLVCHTYSVSSAGGIEDNLLEDANNLAIDIINKIFDVNEITLKRIREEK
jgi:hypothetical protein